MKLKVLENYLNDVTTKYRCIIKDEEKNLILDCLLVKDGLGMEVYMGLLNKKGNHYKRNDEIISYESEIYKKYEPLIMKMWREGKIGELGDRIYKPKKK